MTDHDQVTRKLEERPNRVRQRIQILDLIEEKLLQMRALAQRVANEDLTDKEIENIDKQVQNMAEQIRLLESKSTQLF